MVKGSKPHFRLLTSTLMRSDLSVPHPTTTSIFNLNPSYLSPLLGTSLCSILTDLHLFTDFISYYRFRGGSFGDHESSVFENWNTSLEHRLLSFIDIRPDISPFTRNLKEALRIAAILWMSTGLWNFPLSTSLVRRNAHKLVDALEHCDLVSWCSLYSDLVMWILVVGVCCTPSPGQPRMYLLRKLEAVAIEKGVRHEGDLVGALKRFIWMDGAYERHLPLLWKGVITLSEEDTLKTWNG
jgi:hypothetical protein